MATAVTYFFTPLVLFLLSEDCHDEFFVDFNFFHVPCLKMAISKGLGYGIIVGSSIVKVPQIIKLMRAQSGKGLSVPALFTETFVVISATSYAVQNQFPFSAWGESVFMGVQNCILIVLIWLFSRNYIGALIVKPACAGLCYALCILVPFEYIVKLQGVNVVFTCASKLLQCWTNLSNGHTGQLSFVTVLLLLLGSVARVFTSVQETGDALVIAQFVMASALNLIITVQMLYYWNAAVEEQKTKKQ